MCLNTLHIGKNCTSKNVRALSRAQLSSSLRHTVTHTKTLAMMICTVHLFTRNKPTMQGAATLTCLKYCGSNTLRHPCLNSHFLKWPFFFL